MTTNTPAAGSDLFARNRSRLYLATAAACVAVLVLAGAVALAYLIAPDGGRTFAASLGLDAVGEGEVEFEPLAQRSEVRAADGRLLTVLHGRFNRVVVPLDAVPEHVQQAVVAAEDHRFFEHDGYDPAAIVRAATANLRAGQVVQGASTITQQLAKTQVGTEVSVERKLDELGVALALERRYSKDELLERYLNEVYFGAGAYGVAVAAEEFFAKPLAELSVDEAALLAGLIRSPSDLDPRRNPEAAGRRRDAVLRAMGELGYLAPGEATRLALQPVEVAPHRPTPLAMPYVVDAVKREFLANPVFGDTRDDRIDRLFTGGLVIHATVEPHFQEIAEHTVREWFPAKRGVTAAIVGVDPRDGRVLAAAFGRDFEREEFNLAMQGRRQPGSAFKPFVMAAALKHGFSARHPLRGNSGARFGVPRRTAEWATRGVRNFGGRSYGSVGLVTALVRSVNTAFADLILQVGVDEVVEQAAAMGIDRAAYGDTPTPAIALGGHDRGVTPLEMASAYGTFANGGVHVRPHVIGRVTTPGQEEVYRAEPQARRALDRQVNAVMLDALRKVVRTGTGTRAALPGWPVAGKTGTTQNNRDVWFVGTTPVMSTAVWVGNPDARQRLVGMSSSRTAAPLWRAYMARALEPLDPVTFPD